MLSTTCLWLSFTHHPSSRIIAYWLMFLFVESATQNKIDLIYLMLSYLPSAVVIEFVVTAEHDENSPGLTQREEYLRRGVTPDLKNRNDSQTLEYHTRQPQNKAKHVDILISPEKHKLTVNLTLRTLCTQKMWYNYISCTNNTQWQVPVF